MEVDRARASARTTKGRVTRPTRRGVSPAGQRRKGKRRGAGSGAGAVSARRRVRCAFGIGRGEAPRAWPHTRLSGGRQAGRAARWTCPAGWRCSRGGHGPGAVSWAGVGMLFRCQRQAGVPAADRRARAAVPEGRPGRVRVRRCFRQRRPKACGPGRGARQKEAPDVPYGVWRSGRPPHSKGALMSVRVQCRAVSARMSMRPG
ncbi:MAG: hypothetical protein KatS3mg015_2381 [Fimbriimonadales bacterium]|nr:MAG: hypothetical protein KatS3mg015_2381 [Fimbriimonadales bacterium]